MAENGRGTADPAAVLLDSAGVPDAAHRVADEPGIAMVLGMSRALRSADFGDISPWARRMQGELDD